MIRPLLLCLIALAVGCSGPHPLEQKYDRLKLGMTAEQVTAVMGPGRAVTATELAGYEESPKADADTDLPADIRWQRWGDGYPYLLAGLSQDKLVLARLVGTGPPKRLGR